MKKTFEQQYKEETGLNAYEPNNMRPNIPEDAYVEWLEDKIEQLTIHGISARLYSLQLGERLEHNHLDYFRVPGGWVVALSHGSGSVTSTFVPFNNEFQNVR